MGISPLLREFDERTRWSLLGYGLEGARGVAGAIVASTFTLTVLIFSIILVAVQLSSSQLSPRAIASSVLKDRQAQFTLGLFIFTYILAVAVLGRIDTRVPELPLLIAMVFSVICIAAFLYLIDYVAKALRPVSVCGRIARAGIQVMDAVYPHLVTGTDDHAGSGSRHPGTQSGSYRAARCRLWGIARLRHRGTECGRAPDRWTRRAAAPGRRLPRQG